jgi:phospholipid/cholesterol/gamma-HCH transport system substrate-binding protein
MGNLSANLKVGLFILSGFGALLYMSLMMGGFSFSGKEGRQTFYVYFNMVSGVSEKSQVKVSGVKVGEVGAITLEKRRVKLTLLLDRPVEIPVDSIASIQSAGLLGDMFVNIHPGEADTFLVNGDVLEKSVDPASIDEIMTKLSTVLSDVELFAEGMGDLFSTREGEEGGVANIVANAETASELLLAILEENRENLREGFGNIKSLTGSMDDILGDNRYSFKSAMENLKTSAEKLDAVMDSLQVVSERIAGGEGTVGKLIQDESMYDNLNSTLKATQEFMGSTETLQLGIGARAEYQSQIEAVKSYFSIRIKPREDKFYLFELSEDTRRTDVEIRNTINTVLFTLIVNKRYGDWGFKAGLMESSGGIGLDYYAWRDSILISADLFNLSGYDINTTNPELKITGKYYIQKYIYLYAGGDELLNDYYKSYFGGIGLMVDEEDFKFFLSII